jgi:hypothetical protein
MPGHIDKNWRIRLLDYYKGKKYLLICLLCRFIYANSVYERYQDENILKEAGNNSDAVFTTKKMNGKANFQNCVKPKTYPVLFKLFA